MYMYYRNNPNIKSACEISLEFFNTLKYLLMPLCVECKVVQTSAKAYLCRVQIILNLTDFLLLWFMGYLHAFAKSENHMQNTQLGSGCLTNLG